LNAYDILKGKYTDDAIRFDFIKVEGKEYFIPRFKTFIDEMLETKTINEK
jgi:hypothetical protein